MAGGAKKLGWAFGKITDDNVDATIKNLAGSWYALAVVQAVVLTILVFAQGYSAAQLVDPFAAAAGGYFLRSRKSRALAIVLFLYSLFILATTVAARLGAGQGGTNIILAIIVAYVGWRGIPATWFYQHRRCAEVRWGPTILISLATVGCVLACIFGVAIALAVAEQMGTPASKAVSEFSYAAAEFFPAVLLIAALTLRWPFTQPDAACPWPPKSAV